MPLQQHAATKNLSVIADPHGYGSVGNTGAGNIAVGVDWKATAAFADFWGKFATAIPDKNVVYGLMNEPSAQSAQ